MALLEIELPEALLSQPKQIGQFIRRTQSVCPECNRILPATVFERVGKVFMTKTCPEHGETEELYFGSYDMYQKFATYWSDGKGTHAPNVPIESCDGVSAKTNPKHHWEAPYTIESCRKANLGVVLVPTVIKSINDHELGGILRFAQRNIDIVRAISYQPVSLTGRMKKQEREKYRITIPDCIERIEEQTNGEIPRDAWFPVPSCSPVTHFVEAFTKRPQ